MKTNEEFYDVIIIGGGITGAGVFNEATKRGYRALLVEQGDFASGTSQASSKMVHGGLRYLGQGKLKLTRTALKEREYLLASLPGLVERLTFVFPYFQGKFPPRIAIRILLWIYDSFAGRRTRRLYKKSDLLFLHPFWPKLSMKGALTFEDAATDDVRLVMRTLQEAIDSGGTALNYHKVTKLRLSKNGYVCGVSIVDQQSGATRDIDATLVINATGVWADKLRSDVGQAPVIRPIRGSHIILKSQRIPITQALTFMANSRPVYCFPWYGTTVVGTTDLDHPANQLDDVTISDEEIDFFLNAMNEQFESLHLTREDIQASYSGIRPVIRSHKATEAQASKANRDHEIFFDRGLLTLTGGKLTTFRIMAVEALDQVGFLDPMREMGSFFATPPKMEWPPGLSDQQKRRLLGYYGSRLRLVLDCRVQMDQGCLGLTAIPGCQIFWEELVYAVRHESVKHLDDLLLRRTRLGLSLEHGAASLMPQIKKLLMAELGFSEATWQEELQRYEAICITKHHMRMQHMNLIKKGASKTPQSLGTSLPDLRQHSAADDAHIEPNPRGSL